MATKLASKKKTETNAITVTGFEIWPDKRFYRIHLSNKNSLLFSLISEKGFNASSASLLSLLPTAIGIRLGLEKSHAQRVAWIAFNVDCITSHIVGKEVTYSSETVVNNGKKYTNERISPVVTDTKEVQVPLNSTAYMAIEEAVAAANPSAEDLI